MVHFKKKVPQTQAIKETPRTYKNVVLMQIYDAFYFLNRLNDLVQKKFF
ncbi:TPA: hypothetical protein KRW56_001534 [Clostridioides difficile]|nr:hypothetical protein [Clostridioides difficile]MCJ0451581.1 hypothetical protein [Clostridioides difficile]HBF2256825.1 hypothetical protein [Clostridioides difficile]HBG1667225.1 hypothetical protein [Clostridioides difficile]HBG2002421.1 hypothetical protein [Clostridioides difficile]